MKILILKPSSLGDVIQAMPVLRLLRRHFRDAEIYWWIARELAPLLENDPELTGIYPFERRGWLRPRVWFELAGQLQAARTRQFDWVLDLQGLARSGALAWLAAGKLLVGLDDLREGAPGFYDRAVARPSPQSHAVEWYLEVLRSLHVPVDWNFEWLPACEHRRAALEKKWPAGNARWIAIHPGARWENKRWPAAAYHAVVRELAHRNGQLRFAILGSRTDAALGSQISAAAPDRCRDLTGQTTLPELIEWIRRCAVMVTNDTGPMHVAAALKKPAVALFGPTDPRRTGPFGQLDHVHRVSLPCAPCLKPVCRHVPALECLSSISPVTVVEAVAEILVCGAG